MDIELNRVIEIAIYKADNPLTSEDESEQIDILINDESAVRIEAGSLQLSNSIVDTDIKFGQLISGEFRCTLFNLSTDVSGRKIKVWWIDTTNPNNRVEHEMFTGWIDSAEHDNVNKHRDIIAYDWAYYHRDINVADFWNTFWETNKNATIVRLDWFRSQLLDDLDIMGGAGSLYNDDLNIAGVYDKVTTLTFESLLIMISELQCAFPHINAGGALDFIRLDNTNTADLRSQKYEGDSSRWEDFAFQPISGIAIWEDSNNMLNVIGSDDNPYSISSNLFLLNMEKVDRDQICTALLTQMTGYSYIPCSINMIVSDLNLELGQRILTDKGYSYIMSNELFGSLFVEQTLECRATSGTLKLEGSTYNDNMVNGLKTAKITKDVEQLSSQYSELHDDLVNNYSTTTQTQSMISQSATEIATSVTSTVETYIDDHTYTKAETDSKIQQTADSITTTVSQTYTAKGDAIKQDTLHYLATSASSGVTTSTPGWTTTIQSVTATNKYLWIYHTYTYADSSTQDTTPIISGVYGDKGQKGDEGAEGPQGDDGIGILNVTPLYYAKANQVAPNAPTTPVTNTSTDPSQGWTKAIPALNDSYPYLFTCEQVQYDDASVGRNGYKWTTVVLDKNSTTTYSEIKQTKDTIVLKVDNDGKVAKVAIGSSIGSGDYIVLNADSISLKGKTINISASDVLGISSTNFSVDTAGNVNVKGSINSGSTITGSAISGGTITGSAISGGSLNIGNGQFTVDSSGNMVANNGTLRGTIYATAGKIGGLDIDSTSISSGGASYMVSEGDWQQTGVTMGGEPVYKSQGNYKVNGTTVRTTITISGYSQFALKAVSHGENNYDYMCIGQVDKSNISSSSSSETTTIKKSFYGLSTASVRIDQGAADENIDLTSSSIYTGVVLTIPDSGTHTIEVIYTKDGSQSWGSDRAYFYVDTANCIAASGGGNGFKVASSNFSRTIGGTSLTNLRLALGSNFGVTSSGVLYANGANLNGTMKTGSGTQYVELSNGNITMGKDSALQAVISSSPQTIANVLSFTGHNTTPPSSDVKLRATYGKLTLEGGSANAGVTLTSKIDITDVITLDGTIYSSSFDRAEVTTIDSSQGSSISSTVKWFIKATLTNPGTYIVTGILHTSAAGNLQAGVGTSSGSGSITTRADNSDWLTVTRIIKTTSYNTTVYLVGRSSVSTTVTTGSKIEYSRLG